MKKAESEIQEEIMLALSQHGCKPARRNTGLFYAKRGDKYVPVKIGAPGQSDISGHRPDGKAFYIECKTVKEHEALQSRIVRDKLTQHDKDQLNFLNQMTISGALGGFVSSAEEALEILEIKILK